MQINKQISNKQILIVGLGNPGGNYKNSRHNVGFMAVDKLIQKWQEEEIEKLRNKEIKGIEVMEHIDKKILLLKPLTFMNQSGQAVSLISQYLNISISNIIVIHDDIDLPLGQLKIQKGGGTAGHHGLESIVKSLGTEDFIRFRVGIGRPGEMQNVQCRMNNDKKKNITNYVLEGFTKEEGEMIEKTVERVVEGIEYFLGNELEKTMNKYNKRN